MRLLHTFVVLAEAIAVNKWLDDWIRTAQVGNLGCLMRPSLGDRPLFSFEKYEAHFMGFAVVLANRNTEY